MMWYVMWGILSCVMYILTRTSLTRLLPIQLQRLRHFQFVKEVQQTQQQQRFFQRFFNVGELGAWSFLCLFFFTWCGGRHCDGGERFQQRSSLKSWNLKMRHSETAMQNHQWLPPNPGSSSSASFEVWSPWKAGYRVGRRENLTCPRCHRNG